MDASKIPRPRGVVQIGVGPQLVGPPDMDHRAPSQISELDIGSPLLFPIPTIGTTVLSTAIPASPNSMISSITLPMLDTNPIPLVHPSKTIQHTPTDTRDTRIVPRRPAPAPPATPSSIPRLTSPPSKIPKTPHSMPRPPGSPSAIKRRPVPRFDSMDAKDSLSPRTPKRASTAPGNGTSGTSGLPTPRVMTSPLKLVPKTTPARPVPATISPSRIASPVIPASKQSSKGGSGPKPPNQTIPRVWRNPTSPTPSHIRSRLRLIHQLGQVLDLPAKEIASRIDVPGLLARVDLAYAKGNVNGAGVVGRDEAHSVGMSPGATGTSSDRSGDGSGKTSAVSSGSKLPRPRMLQMFRKLGKKRGGTGPVEKMSGPVFGIPLNEAPEGSWCTSLIGGQKHQLPLVLFTLIEEIYRRGMSEPGVFRLSGDSDRIAQLVHIYDSPPQYGDHLYISTEPIHNLTGTVKRYVRDLPEPILDEALFSGLLGFCVDVSPNHDSTGSASDHQKRILAAQIILKLQPPLHFSLSIYLLAFLGQLSYFPVNRLSINSVSSIFGPAFCASRCIGISGLGKSNPPTSFAVPDPDEVARTVDQSVAILSWLLSNWAGISERVLDPLDSAVDEHLKSKPLPAKTPPIDKPNPELLAPIDLRQGSKSTLDPLPFDALVPTDESSKSQTDPHALWLSWSSSLNTPVPGSRSPSPAPPGQISRSSSNHSLHRVKSVQFGRQSSPDFEENKPMLGQRSASFSSLSNLLRRGSSSRSSNDLKQPRESLIEVSHTPGSPETQDVLGSLQDLLISKDKQIEKDARELAILRYTLLDMDEKLLRLRAATPDSPGFFGLPDMYTPPGTPAITVTSEPSTASDHSAGGRDAGNLEEENERKEREMLDLQGQLDTAVAALENAKSERQSVKGRMEELEIRLQRAEEARKREMGRLKVALAEEQAKVQGLEAERERSRDRLERIRSTLFQVE